MNNTLEAVLNDLKDQTKSAPVFYVTLDPERALGVHDILADYHVICPSVCDVTRELEPAGVHVFVLGEQLQSSQVEAIVRLGSFGIIQESAVVQYIQKASSGRTACIAVLKNTEIIKERTEAAGFKLLGPEPKVADLFEEKLSQFELLNNKVDYPRTRVATLSQLSDDEIELPAIIQFNRGHSGNSTVLIRDLDQFRELQQNFPLRSSKISQFIDGVPFTMNGLVLGNGRVMHGSISLQLTGLKEATSNPNTTVGNDFNGASQALSTDEAEKIREVLEIVGQAMFVKGYRGMFGIDVVKGSNSGKIYFIEVNTHQPASISFEAQLHRHLGCLPIIGAFYADAFGIEIPNQIIQSVPLLIQNPARQIIYRNKSDAHIDPRSLTLPVLGVGEKVIRSSRRSVGPNGEIFRIQRTHEYIQAPD